MSASIFAAGIFATEPGQRFLQILHMIGERGFRGLYDKCSNNVEGEYFQTGLRRVHLWSEDVIIEDTSFIRSKCPDIDETYETCFVRYVTERYNSKSRATVNCPDVLLFVRSFLEFFGQHEEVTSGLYFSKRDIVNNRVACMDASRQALYSLITTENVRVELASDVGTTFSRNLADTSREQLNAAATQIPEELEVVVNPNDSISQIGTERPARAPTNISRVSSVRQHPTIQAPSTVSHAQSYVSPPSPPAQRVSPAQSSHVDNVPERNRDFRHVADNMPHPEANRHDFAIEEPEHVDDPVVVRRVSSKTSAVGSRDSSVSIGIKRIKSPRQ